jgi:hypothetical protein
MLLRRIERRKNGKTHLYWSVVENKCLDCGRVVQRHVLYLGDARVPRNVASRFPDHDLANARDFGAINFVGQDQLVAGGGVAQSGRGVRYRRRRLPDAGLVPEDRGEVVSADDASEVRLRLSGMRLHRPRQWGACWLAGLLWRELQLDRFWAERLPASRKRTRWDEILQVLVAYRLIEPGSEGRLHRGWFRNSAMADLLGADFALAEGGAARGESGRGRARRRQLSRHGFRRARAHVGPSRSLDRER